MLATLGPTCLHRVALVFPRMAEWIKMPNGGKRPTENCQDHMHACMRACVYLYIYIHTHIYIYIRIYIYIYICV